MPSHNNQRDDQPCAIYLHAISLAALQNSAFLHLDQRAEEHRVQCLRLPPLPPLPPPLRVSRLRRRRPAAGAAPLESPDGLEEIASVSLRPLLQSRALSVRHGRVA